MGTHNRDPGTKRAEVLSKLAIKAGKAALCFALSATGTSAAMYAANVGTNHEFNIGSQVPDKLPPAVAAAISKAVYLNTDLPPSLIEKGLKEPGNADKNLSLSGVALGNGNFLSAGHALKSAQNQPLSGSRCSNYIINGRLPSGVSYSAQANQAAARVDFDKNTDISVFHLSSDSLQELAGMGVNLEGQNGLKIAKQLPVKGDTLFFVNWEPTASGQIRNPMSTNNQLARPAIFAGTITDINDGLATVVTGERSYDNHGMGDDVGRLGESGGLVLNGHGELVGLSNQSSAGFSTEYKIGESILNFHMGPFGLPHNGIDISGVNLVTSAQVSYWENQAEIAPACPYVPDSPMSTMTDSRQYNALGA